MAIGIQIGYCFGNLWTDDNGTWSRVFSDNSNLMPTDAPGATWVSEWWDRIYHNFQILLFVWQWQAYLFSYVPLFFPTIIMHENIICRSINICTMHTLFFVIKLEVLFLCHLCVAWQSPQYCHLEQTVFKDDFLFMFLSFQATVLSEKFQSASSVSLKF